MKRKTYRNLGSIELLGMAFETVLGIPASPSASVPPCRVVADFRMDLDLAPAAETDAPSRAFDFEHLKSRLRAVAASRPRQLPETLARDFSTVLLAEDRVHRAEVRLSVPPPPGVAGEPELQITYVRAQTREDPPRASARMRMKVMTMKLEGALLKGFSHLYHAVFPLKRWTIPDSDPARPDARPVRQAADTPVPRIVWQTNFSSACSLPLWFNYRRNRRLSRDFEHRYVSTEERRAYLEKYASPRLLAAYDRLEDGAAQADLWRLFVLWREGGVYMDFDASLIRPLGDILAGREEVRVWNRKRYTNYFMATVPGNPVYAKMIDAVLSLIEHHGGGELPRVFYATGPGALETVLDSLPPFDYVPCRDCCIQGVFSNEHFQYIDRPGTKWTRKRTFIRPLGDERKG